MYVCDGVLSMYFEFVFFVSSIFDSIKIQKTNIACYYSKEDDLC